MSINIKKLQKPIQKRCIIFILILGNIELQGIKGLLHPYSLQIHNLQLIKREDIKTALIETTDKGLHIDFKVF